MQVYFVKQEAEERGKSGTKLTLVELKAAARIS